LASLADSHREFVDVVAGIILVILTEDGRELSFDLAQHDLSAQILQFFRDGPTEDREIRQVAAEVLSKIERQIATTGEARYEAVRVKAVASYRKWWNVRALAKTQGESAASAKVR
jgi:hypothetical protein